MKTHQVTVYVESDETLDKVIDNLPKEVSASIRETTNDDQTLFTEEELFRLGFKKNEVSAQESGGEAYSYFCRDYDDLEIALISDALNEGETGLRTIELFNAKHLRPLTRKTIENVNRV